MEGSLVRSIVYEGRECSDAWVGESEEMHVGVSAVSRAIDGDKMHGPGEEGVIGWMC